MKKILNLILTIFLIKGITADLESIWEREQINEDELNEFMWESTSFTPFSSIDERLINTLPFDDIYIEEEDKFRFKHEVTDDLNGKITETYIDPTNNEELTVVKESGKIVYQYLDIPRYNGKFRSYSIFDNGDLRKISNYIDSFITVEKHYWKTEYGIRRSLGLINIFEYYTTTENGDVIKSLEIGTEKIETAVRYANGDWYYAKSKGKKEIIMGMQNYKNRCFQDKSTKRRKIKYIIENGIYYKEFGIVGNIIEMRHLETNSYFLFINNGIIMNENMILINGYPECISRNFTDDLAQNFEAAYSKENNNSGLLKCITNQNKTYVMKNNPPLKEIFTTNVTKWDACCRLKYTLKNEDEKVRMVKENNFIEHGKPGNIENIINLGAALKYVDGDNQVIWRLQASSEESTSSH